MNIRTKALITGMFVSICALTPCLQAKPKELPPQVVDLRPDDLTTIVVGRAEVSGIMDDGKGDRIKNSIAGFYAPDVTATFQVNAPEAADYAVGVIICAEQVETMEVRCGQSVLTVESMEKTWKGAPHYWRQEIPGVLSLRKGLNEIVFRLPQVQPGKPQRNLRLATWRPQKDEFTLVSIELGTPAARAARIERADAMRSSADWMAEGKYGLFVHWSANATGFNIPEKRAEWFQESVKMFDVEHFANEVERTGAAWVTFTAIHQGFYWPAPSKAVDAVMPGRTSERDLLGEVIDTLDKRGIKTLFYFHSGYNGVENKAWRAAAGADYRAVNSSTFSDHMEAIFREASLRYGKKLMGFGYIDGCLMHDYPLDPHWEGWARAIKAGNPDALIGFSSNLGPTVSIFSDLSTRDGAGGLNRPTMDQVGPGLQYGDVAPAWWCFMDTWLEAKPMNGRFPSPPVRSEKEYVNYFKEMAKVGVPVTINLVITSDVTDDHPIFNPECMAIMEKVREAVRGE